MHYIEVNFFNNLSLAKVRIIFKAIVPNSSIHIGINSIDEIALHPNEIVGRIPNKNVDIIKVSKASFLLKKVLDNKLLCFDILVFTVFST